MAESVYCNYRLYKTMSKLSGNMKLDLVLGVGSDGNAYVRQAHIRPISGTAYTPLVDERIMDRPHQNNIKQYFDKFRSLFYNADPAAEIGSDWFMTVSKHEMNNLKYIKNWDDSFLAGAQRMSYKLYGTTHEILVPVWLDKCNGIKFQIKFIHIDPATGLENVAFQRDLNLSEEYLYGNVNGTPFPYNSSETFHNDFVKYLMDYFNYIKVIDGNTNVMNVQFKTGISSVSGLMVESGNFGTRQNYNIANNLMYRERPLLESNSLLTNTFSDYKMICTQLMNFNLCIDLENFIGSSSLADLMGNGNMCIQVDVLALRNRSDMELYYTQRLDRSDLYKYYAKSQSGSSDTEYRWEGPLEVRDFYTNHDYVPRPQAKYDYGAGSDVQYYDDGEGYWWNALDYKQDNKCTDIMHKNKLVQSICHWVYAFQPDGILFNVYDGFGAYAKVGDKYIEYNHGFGTTTDTTVDQFDPSADNTIWAGPPRIGDGADVENTLNAPQPWIENGYFKDASKFIGGFKFGFNSTGTGPKRIWLGTMTTPWQATTESRITAASSYMTSRHVIGILVERLNGEGENDLPDKRINQGSNFDINYDWHLHSDIDNRFSIKKYLNGQELFLRYNPQKIELSEDFKAQINAAKAETDATKQKALYVQIYERAKREGIIEWVDKETAKQADNETHIRVGGIGYYNTSMRQHMNSTALYLAFRRMSKGDGLMEDDDDLCLILWHPRAQKSVTERATSERLLYGDLYPHGLTIGGFINAVRDYYNKYSPCMTAIDLVRGDTEGSIDFPENLPDMENMESILGAVTSVQPLEVIWFDRSIQPTPDLILSKNAQEVTYYKKPGINNYVLRYSGNIKPAMYPEKVVRRINMGEKDHLSYLPTFGRNFAYLKSMVFPMKGMDPDSRLYISTGIPPRYPSLNYECIVPMIRSVATDASGAAISNECKESPHGDILYNEPYPKFFGLELDGTQMYAQAPYNSYYMPNVTKHSDTQDVAYGTFEWFEYKWYDKSRILQLPKTLKYIIKVDNNDATHLNRAAWTVMAYPDSIDELKYSNGVMAPGATQYFDVEVEGSNTIYKPIRATYLVSGDEKIPPIKLKGVPYIVDFPFLNNTYDLEFNLIQTQAKTTNIGEYVRDPRTLQVLYEYTYEVIATLK